MSATTVLARLLWRALSNERKTMSALNDLQAAVASNTDTIGKGVAEIAALKEQVADLTQQLNDGAALAAMATQVAADDASLSAAIAST